MTRITSIVGALLLAGCAGAPMPTERGPEPACTTSAGVTWLRSVAAAERTAQDAWCAGVGAPVIRHAAGALPVADSVLVVTWNVKVGGGDVRGFVGALGAGALTGGEPVRHFVLLLQEVHRQSDAVPKLRAGMRRAPRIASGTEDGRREAIDDVAHDLGLSLVYVPSMRNGGAEREDRGNAILASVPLADVVAAELPLVRQRRVAVTATAAARTAAGRPWRLQLTTVHLENRPENGFTGVAERARQMQWLLAELPDARQVVLGGDLNTWARGAAEPAFRLAQRALPDAGKPPAERTHAVTLLPDLRLDYLLARLPGGRAGEQVRYGARFGSDHYPLLAWVHPG